MEKPEKIEENLFVPKTKKTAVKKTVQTAAGRVAAKEGSELVAKALVKTGAKVGTKSLAKGLANPYLLLADGVDLGVRKMCESADMDEDTAKVVGKSSGLAASVGIGAAVGGPVGAGAGLLLWGIGEGVAKLFGWD